MHILIVSKSNLKLQVFDLFSRFVRTLIIKISSSEEPANSTSIHRVRNGGKLVILFHPSPKNITERCRSLSWKPAKARWKYQNGAERAEQIFLAHAQQNAPLLSLPATMAVWSEIFTYHFRLQPEQQSVAALLWQGCNLGTRSSSYAVVLETWGILFISELNWEVFFRPSSTRGTESSVVQPVCECLLPLKEYLQISATLDVQFLNISEISRNRSFAW